MTCETCTKWLDILPDKLTRAERSAVIGHLHSCSACRAIIRNAGPNEAYRATARRLLEGDLADPEFDGRSVP